MSNKKFTIPKKTASTELLQELDSDSRQYKDLSSNIGHSLWNSKCGLLVNKIELVNNPELTSEYTKKKLAMQKKDARSSKEIVDMYGYRYAENHKLAKEMCKTGLTTASYSVTKINCLGDPQFGVYLSRCADILTRGPPRMNLPFMMVVFSIIKGRIKVVSEQHGFDQVLTEPTPDFDGHFSKDFRKMVNKPHSNMYSKIFDYCQMFLYEFDLSSNDLYAKKPRQCMPYAVVHFTFVPPPVVEKPIAEPQIKAVAQKPQEIDAQDEEKSDPNDPLAPGSIFSKALESAQILWTGKLYNKGSTMTDIRIVCHSHSVISLPLLSDLLTFRMKMKTSQLKKYLPKWLFRSTPLKAKLSKVLKNGREFLHTEMYPVNKRSTSFARLQRYLTVREEALKIKLQEDYDLFILPTCDLTMQLGITDEGYPDVLHLLFTSKISDMHRIQEGCSNFYKHAQTVLCSRILELEKHKLITPVQHPPPIIDISNESISPFQDYDDIDDKSSEYPIYFTNQEKAAICIGLNRMRKAAKEEMMMSGQHNTSLSYSNMAKPVTLPTKGPFSDHASKEASMVQNDPTKTRVHLQHALDPRLSGRSRLSQPSNLPHKQRQILKSDFPKTLSNEPSKGSASYDSSISNTRDQWHNPVLYSKASSQVDANRADRRTALMETRSSSWPHEAPTQIENIDKQESRRDSVYLSNKPSPLTKQHSQDGVLSRVGKAADTRLLSRIPMESTAASFPSSQLYDTEKIPFISDGPRAPSDLLDNYDTAPSSKISRSASSSPNKPSTNLSSAVTILPQKNSSQISEKAPTPHQEIKPKPSTDHYGKDGGSRSKKQNAKSVKSSYLENTEKLSLGETSQDISVDSKVANKTLVATDSTPVLSVSATLSEYVSSKSQQENSLERSSLSDPRSWLAVSETAKTAKTSKNDFQSVPETSQSSHLNLHDGVTKQGISSDPKQPSSVSIKFPESNAGKRSISREISIETPHDPKIFQKSAEENSEPSLVDVIDKIPNPQDSLESSNACSSYAVQAPKKLLETNRSGKTDKSRQNQQHIIKQSKPKKKETEESDLGETRDNSSFVGKPNVNPDPSSILKEVGTTDKKELKSSLYPVYCDGELFYNFEGSQDDLQEFDSVSDAEEQYQNENCKQAGNATGRFESSNSSIFDFQCHSEATFRDQEVIGSVKDREVSSGTVLDHDLPAKSEAREHEKLDTTTPNNNRKNRSDVRDNFVEDSTKNGNMLLVTVSTGCGDSPQGNESFSPIKATTKHSISSRDSRLVKIKSEMRDSSPKALPVTDLRQKLISAGKYSGDCRSVKPVATEFESRRRKMTNETDSDGSERTDEHDVTVKSVVIFPSKQATSSSLKGRTAEKSAGSYESSRMQDSIKDRVRSRDSNLNRADNLVRVTSPSRDSKPDRAGYLGRDRGSLRDSKPDSRYSERGRTLSRDPKCDRAINLERSRGSSSDSKSDRDDYSKRRRGSLRDSKSDRTTVSERERALARDSTSHRTANSERSRGSSYDSKSDHACHSEQQGSLSKDVQSCRAEKAATSDVDLSEGQAAKRRRKENWNTESKRARIDKNGTSQAEESALTRKNDHKIVAGNSLQHKQRKETDCKLNGNQENNISEGVKASKENKSSIRSYEDRSVGLNKLTDEIENAKTEVNTQSGQASGSLKEDMLPSLQPKIATSLLPLPSEVEHNESGSLQLDGTSSSTVKLTDKAESPLKKVRKQTSTSVNWYDDEELKKFDAASAAIEVDQTTPVTKDLLGVTEGEEGQVLSASTHSEEISNLVKVHSLSQDGTGKNDLQDLDSPGKSDQKGKPSLGKSTDLRHKPMVASDRSASEMNDERNNNEQDDGKVVEMKLCDDRQNDSKPNSSPKQIPSDSEPESQAAGQAFKESHYGTEIAPVFSPPNIMLDLMSWSQNRAKLISKSIVSPTHQEKKQDPSDSSSQAHAVIPETKWLSGGEEHTVTEIEDDFPTSIGKTSFLEPDNQNYSTSLSKSSSETQSTLPKSQGPSHLESSQAEERRNLQTDQGSVPSQRLQVELNSVPATATVPKENDQRFVARVRPFRHMETNNAFQQSVAENKQPSSVQISIEKRKRFDRIQQQNQQKRFENGQATGRMAIRGRKRPLLTNLSPPNRTGFLHSRSPIVIRQKHVDQHIPSLVSDGYDRFYDSAPQRNLRGRRSSLDESGYHNISDGQKRIPRVASQSRLLGRKEVAHEQGPRVFSEPGKRVFRGRGSNDRYSTGYRQGVECQDEGVAHFDEHYDEEFYDSNDRADIDPHEMDSRFHEQHNYGQDRSPRFERSESRDNFRSNNNRRRSRCGSFDQEAYFGDQAPMFDRSKSSCDNFPDREVGDVDTWLDNREQRDFQERRHVISDIRHRGEPRFRENYVGTPHEDSAFDHPRYERCKNREGFMEDDIPSVRGRASVDDYSSRGHINRGRVTPVNVSRDRQQGDFNRYPEKSLYNGPPPLMGLLSDDPENLRCYDREKEWFDVHSSNQKPFDLVHRKRKVEDVGQNRFSVAHRRDSLDDSPTITKRPFFGGLLGVGKEKTVSAQRKRPFRGR